MENWQEKGWARGGVGRANKTIVTGFCLLISVALNFFEIQYYFL